MSTPEHRAFRQTVLEILKLLCNKAALNVDPWEMFYSSRDAYERLQRERLEHGRDAPDEPIPGGTEVGRPKGRKVFW
jgi:hypothetical protein